MEGGSMAKVHDDEVIAAFRTVGEWVGRLVLRSMEAPAATAPVEPPPVVAALNREKAAKYLGISRSTVNRLVKSGRLPAIAVTGKATRYRVEDLDRLIRDRIVRPRRT
jgi:excisionase family DNA binding protein